MATETDNTAIYAYVLVTIAAITVLSIFLISCKNKSCSPYNYSTGYPPVRPVNPAKPVRPVNPAKPVRPIKPGNNKCDMDICVCDLMGQKRCSNRDALRASYEAGNTEYQTFYKPPDYWKSTNFNIY